MQYGQRILVGAVDSGCGSWLVPIAARRWRRPGFGGSVPAHIATQNAEVRQKVVRLLIPEAVIGAERVHENYDWFIFVAIESIELPDSAGICDWHVCLPDIIPSG